MTAIRKKGIKYIVIQTVCNPGAPSPREGWRVIMHHAFDLTARDRQMAVRARCVCLSHSWTCNGAALSRPRCYATVIRCVERQQVCVHL